MSNILVKTTLPLLSRLHKWWEAQRVSAETGTPTDHLLTYVINREQRRANRYGARVHGDVMRNTRGARRTRKLMQQVGVGT